MTASATVAAPSTTRPAVVAVAAVATPTTLATASLESRPARPAGGRPEAADISLAPATTPVAMVPVVRMTELTPGHGSSHRRNLTTGRRLVRICGLPLAHRRPEHSGSERDEGRDDFGFHGPAVYEGAVEQVPLR